MYFYIGCGLTGASNTSDHRASWMCCAAPSLIHGCTQYWLCSVSSCLIGRFCLIPYIEKKDKVCPRFSALLLPIQLLLCTYANWCFIIINIYGCNCIQAAIHACIVTTKQLQSSVYQKLFSTVSVKFKNVNQIIDTVEGFLF